MIGCNADIKGPSAFVHDAMSKLIPLGAELNCLLRAWRTSGRQRNVNYDLYMYLS